MVAHMVNIGSNKRFNLRSLRSPDWAEKASPAGLT
jgi:hypothetical protein